MQHFLWQRYNFRLSARFRLVDIVDSKSQHSKRKNSRDHMKWWQKIHFAVNRPIRSPWAAE